MRIHGRVAPVTSGRTRRRFNLFALFHLVFIAANACATEITPRLGPSATRVVVESVKDPELASRTAMDHAANALGVSGVVPDRFSTVRLVDSGPFGTKAGIVWLAEYEALIISRRGRGVTKLWEELSSSTLTADIRIVLDPLTGTVLMAYSPSKEEWIQPVLPLRDPVEEALEDGWKVSDEPVGHTRSSVAEVLRVVRNHLGPAGRRAGQIVLRPREVANRWPQHKVDGEWVSDHPSGVAWIVEVLATVSVPISREEYMTYRLLLIDDETLEVYRGLYLP